ncbi:MAG: carbohydrate ABC transporter permease [Clostridia bacterium]|nr:carbohydrate ABC transporter permease [Clostridia bacterium]
MKRKRGQIILNLVFIIISLCVIVPFVMLVSISLTSEKEIVASGYKLIPSKLDLSAYKYVFSNPHSIINAYKITFIFSATSMILSTLLTAMAAYPLISRSMLGKKQISFYYYFTMLFSGGMVPTYILITRYLHLDDTILVYILPALINPWNIFMMRTFFKDIPSSIVESAYIDGASEYATFFKIILPLSKPVLATIALLVFLTKWNDWMASMLYINNQNLISLQYLLQRILQNLDVLQSMNSSASTVNMNISDIPAESTRMAMAVVVAGPALLVFPFFQKYFVKGLTVGSVKG